MHKLLNGAAARWGVVALVVLMHATPAHAAEAPTVAADPVLEARTMEIASELRCLVCQNQTIADSNAELAVDLREQVRQMLRLAAPADGWVVPVVTSSAARGQIADLVSALDERRAWLDEDDRWAARRRQRAAAEVLALAVGRSRVLLAEGLRPDDVDAVASGRLTAFAAADRLVGGATPHPD